MYLVSTVAALGGLLFGFDTAVVNGAIVFLRREFQLTELQTEIAAASLLLGCVLGAAAGGGLSDRFGRKKLLLAAAALFLISSLGAALPRNLLEFVAARFLGGLAIGAASMICPMYIAEISPAAIRGRLVTLNQLAIVVGILCAFLVNWQLAGLGSNSWRWMFAVAGAPSIVFLLSLLAVPESPRWLTRNGRAAEAEGVLARLNGAERAAQEIIGIRRTIEEEEAGSWRDLFRPPLRRPVWIAILLAVFSQVTGINTILYYGAVIFTEQVKTGGAQAALWANVIIGAVNFAGTIVAIALLDRVGRKPLLMFAAGGMAACLGVLASVFRIVPLPAAVVLPLILGYVACFAVGLGPGTWLLMSELFPTSVRGRAMSVATIALWVACLFITLTFLSLVSAVGASGAFGIYGALCVVTLLFLWRWVPETKGRTLEEIEKSWR